jgi:hypothetical protein
VRTFKFNLNITKFADSIPDEIIWIF